jgi:hypothetical protein
MLQCNYCQRLSIPTIEDSKYRKTRHGYAKNIGQIGRFKTSDVATSRIFQQSNNQFLCCFDESGSDLWAIVMNCNSIPIVADTTIKSRMNAQLSGHER